jgi:2-deoxy-D-gluconate 3-dehydrogenase
MTISPEIQYAPLSTAGLEGKIALVTGGTRGIGKGIVLALAAAGARVVVTGRGQANAEDVLSEVRARGGEGGFVAADLFADDDVEALVGKTVAEFGGLDILVNNAGIDADGLALDYPLESWQRILRFNLEVPFRLCQQAGKHMIANGGGAIINIASVLAFVGVQEASSYAASKHGLIGLTKNLAIEWSSQGVRVNAVAPGLIQTDMTQYLWQSEYAEAYISGRIPQGRIGQPNDIGGAVVFLASPSAKFIHGQTIAVDGGFLAT